MISGIYLLIIKKTKKKKKDISVPEKQLNSYQVCKNDRSENTTWIMPEYLPQDLKND